MSIFNWIKKRWIYLYVIGSLMLIELIGVAVTSHCFYIRRPWIFIFVLGIVFIILFYLKTYMAKFVVGASIICAFGIVDLIFIIIFEMTGQYFDFSMFFHDFFILFVANLDIFRQSILFEIFLLVLSYCLHNICFF